MPLDAVVAWGGAEVGLLPALPVICNPAGKFLKCKSFVLLFVWDVISEWLVVTVSLLKPEKQRS